MQIPPSMDTDPPDDASPEPLLQLRADEEPEPRVAAAAVEPSAAAGGGEPRVAVAAVEPRAVEPLAGAGAVEPPDGADAVEPRAGELRAMEDAVEQHDGADAVKPSTDELHAMVSSVEPHAATDLPSAKPWNGLDSDFAAAWTSSAKAPAEPPLRRPGLPPRLR
ncbi:hypothetical protein ACP70R_042519 [Stipagrostis hirtigluma subsp. patula]